MAKYIAGFIGCGNMGGPMMAAVSKILDSKDIAVCGKNKERADAYAATLGVNSTSKEDIAANAKWIFLGVKPQILSEILAEIKPILNKREDEYIIVSMAAGKKITAVSDVIGTDNAIIRIMPNTPVTIGEGMISYCCNDKVTPENIADFMSVMQYTGKIVRLDESLMDAGCSVAGCGPAFVYMFIDALAKGGEACGLDREDALYLAAQTVYGSAGLLMSGKDDPQILRDRVCSPGGSTIEGVKSLQSDDFEQIVIKAVKESNRRNIELGK